MNRPTALTHIREHQLPYHHFPQPPLYAQAHQDAPRFQPQNTTPAITSLLPPVIRIHNAPPPTEPCNPPLPLPWADGLGNWSKNSVYAQVCPGIPNTHSNAQPLLNRPALPTSQPLAPLPPSASASPDTRPTASLPKRTSSASPHPSISHPDPVVPAVLLNPHFSSIRPNKQSKGYLASLDDRLTRLEAMLETLLPGATSGSFLAACGDTFTSETSSSRVTSAATTPRAPPISLSCPPPHQNLTTPAMIESWFNGAIEDTILASMAAPRTPESRVRSDTYDAEMPWAEAAY